MNERRTLRQAAGVLAALLAAGGCSSQSVPAGIADPAVSARTAAPLPASRLSAVRRTIGQRSTIDRAKAKGRLLYVADAGTNAILVYTYPQLSGAGALSGFGSVDGVCTDRRGYVWVLDTSDVVAWEFDHGGTQPINEVQPGDASGNPGVGDGCAVNPKNGDLAVAGAGSGFTVFRNGQFTHSTYWDFGFFDFKYAGYDGSGNLFVDGESQPPYFTFGLDELPAGSSGIKQIVLAGGAITRPGGIQWDGAHLDIGDGASGTIYQTDGASILGSIGTTAACQGQFFITGNHRRAVVPDPCSAQTGVYAYPAGGSPLKTASGGESIPLGAAISVSP